MCDGDPVAIHYISQDLCTLVYPTDVDADLDADVDDYLHPRTHPECPPDPASSGRIGSKDPQRDDDSISVGANAIDATTDAVVEQEEDLGDKNQDNGFDDHGQLADGK